ncbi:MAG: S-methyl-5-thioribose-1-phosphate isomerase [Euryarchaeota archaeon]|nr:S-methyl-5-thioribose-1-phosphate isomerase [Euryarchaeota archaeon]
MDRHIAFSNETLKILDQTLLPHKKKYIKCKKTETLIEAIKSLRIRGAPALGVAGAYGVIIAALESKNEKEFIKKTERIKKARPTAVNLAWGVKKVLSSVDSYKEIEKMKKTAHKIHKDDIERNKKIGVFGANIVNDGDAILTHCNAGALATGGYGTALGVIRAAAEKNIHIFVDETRPLCQGSRLTAWELKEEGIPATLITDSAAGFLMRQGKIDLTVTGADRIAMNGDTANKIGTYSLAVLAAENKIPFYIAAPLSTFDPDAETGRDIPVEYRDEKEVLYLYGKLMAADIPALNPAFDITHHRYITGIITEKGIISPPYEKNIKSVLG